MTVTIVFLSPVGGVESWRYDIGRAVASSAASSPLHLVLPRRHGMWSSMSATLGCCFGIVAIPDPAVDDTSEVFYLVASMVSEHGRPWSWSYPSVRRSPMPRSTRVIGGHRAPISWMRSRRTKPMSLRRIADIPSRTDPTTHS